MYDFLRISSAVPKVSVACPKENTERIFSLLEKVKKENTDIVVFPELCITGYTCGDLFFQKSLTDSALEELKIISSTLSSLASNVSSGSQAAEALADYIVSPEKQAAEDASSQVINSTLNNFTGSGSGAGNSGSGSGGDSSMLEVTYTETPYEDIVAAFNEGKHVFFNRYGYIYSLVR